MLKKKYLISYIPSAHPEAHTRFHFEHTTSAQPGTFGFWFEIDATFPGSINKLEWIEID